jgi:hypothetical protein
MQLLTDTISIRLATPDDEHSLARLAQLDSAEPLTGALLLAECGGQPRAALSLRDGATIADPFAHTEELLALLRVRAERLRGDARLLARLRGALFSRRHRRAYAA